MADKGLLVDDRQHELILGESFDPKSRVAYHSIRYDFKPASVDTTKDAHVEIGEGHHVTLTVPHVEGSGKTHTVYKGNKRPVSKECVLIIDHDTGTFTLERLTNNINVKKTRFDSSKAAPIGRPVTPVEHKVKLSPSKGKPSQSPTSQVKQPSPQRPTPVLAKGSSVIGEISDSSSDSEVSSDSDSDSDDNAADKGHGSAPMTTVQPLITNPPAVTVKTEKPKGFMNLISHDLCLSDSSDDSD